MSKNKSNRNKKTKGNKFVPQENKKGNWPFSFFQRLQKGGLSINEPLVKTNLLTTSFDPYRINDMMNPQLSIEEKLIQKKLSNKKLNSKETIILQNYLDKCERDINNDIISIEKYKLNAEVFTKEGRIRKLFLLVSHYFEIQNDKLLFYVYQKILDMNLNDKLKKEFNHVLKKIKQKINLLDTLQLQFIDFHSNMPPLNNKKFTELEPFQKEVITCINNNESCIVSAPTSSGKSIITSYLATKQCKILVIVPTDILAWQLSALFGKFTKSEIPIVTRTFESDLELDNLLQKINNAPVFIGTPTEVTNILPLISNINFDRLVVDEIHMMGEAGFEDMETIFKVYKDIPFIALSATIGNIEQLHEWFTKLNHQKVNIIKCTKRFMNQQKYYYDGKFKKIHPLSLVSIEHFEDKSILSRDIKITPPDVWDLVIKLESKIDIESLDIYEYFKDNLRIELEDVKKYFYKILEFMIVKFNSNEKEIIISILKHYNCPNIPVHDYNLVDVAFNLKANKKTPAILFQMDEYCCSNLVKKFSHDIRDREYKKYPDLRKQRMKQTQKNKHLEKKRDQLKLNKDNLGDKKKQKQLMNDKLDRYICTEIIEQEPHKDFIFHNHHIHNHHYIEEINNQLKKYFPMNGDEYNFIIDLLWRGVGVYIKGLPDPYLNIVQQLACNGKLPIIFSDKSLVFGVSMPIRTSVIVAPIGCKDTLDPMWCQQAEGRAGRRGLDNEGNVVLVGFTWKRIKELLDTKIPNIKGLDSLTYGAYFGNKLANMKNTGDTKWNNIKSTFLLDEITDQYANEWFDDINHNISSGAWNFCNSENLYFNHLLWKLRYSEDCFRIAFLIKYIKLKFNSSVPNNERDQIELAKFMCTFFFIKENEENTLEISKEFIEIVEKLDNLELSVSPNIDLDIFISIRNNKLIEYEESIKNNELRLRLLDFGDFMRHVQHYFYYTKQTTIAKLFGKLLTRCYWIFHNKSLL